MGIEAYAYEEGERQEGRRGERGGKGEREYKGKMEEKETRYERREKGHRKRYKEKKEKRGECTHANSDETGDQCTYTHVYMYRDLLQVLFKVIELYGVSGLCGVG